MPHWVRQSWRYNYLRHIDRLFQFSTEKKMKLRILHISFSFVKTYAVVNYVDTSCCMIFSRPTFFDVSLTHISSYIWNSELSLAIQCDPTSFGWNALTDLTDSTTLFSFETSSNVALIILVFAPTKFFWALLSISTCVTFQVIMFCGIHN